LHVVEFIKKTTKSTGEKNLQMITGNFYALMVATEV
jgi:hypothetical protein